jgi:hypothetical protein
VEKVAGRYHQMPGIQVISRQVGGYKLVAPQLGHTTVLWVRIQTPVKNTKWATEAKDWPTHNSRKKIRKLQYCNTAIALNEHESDILNAFFLSERERYL